MGRYGMLRTSDAVSPIAAQNVGVSLAAFVIVYFMVFGTGIYYILRLIKQGPPESDREHPPWPITASLRVPDEGRLL